ncbi:MAG TPA: Ig-like domain-containing protein, partial [Pyrinomonadaceae bacterium]|nr:Ig-like domain-containing protein [Pyrinomonadaceae bacterium]
MKRRYAFALRALLLTALAVTISARANAQAKVATVEISPNPTEAVAGQKMKFTATAKDDAGKTLDLKPGLWVALPVDSAVADAEGNVTFFEPGEIKVVAVVAGKPGFAKVNVKPASITQIDVDPPSAQVAVGGTLKLNATPRVSNGNPRNDVAVVWTSSAPRVAMVDPAGFVTGVAPGKATLSTSAGSLSRTVTVQVVANPVRALSIAPATTTARTGDVIHFRASAKNLKGGEVPNPSVRWAVSGDGAMVYPDGAFLAERPGSYVLTATSGGQTAVATIVVAPRNVGREIQVVGHALLKDTQIAEQWIFGNYAYVSTISDKLYVYDISDPAKPKQTDSVKVDAHTINDISVTPDGRVGVLTREGSSNRKDGIVFLDTSDPAHPKIISEYTETVTGGVHSAYIDGHYVYLTDDATGSMRVIDFADVKHPREVARWQVENPLVTTGGIPGGRYLHDVQIKDGFAYLAYWRDGVVILDVGNGLKGGSPEKPQFVSQLRFNYHELYGSGWLAGAHAVFRYKNYLFVGDEVFPELFDISSKNRIPVRGVMHVVDVSDITHPRKVAEYGVPEAGSHNIWVLDDILYMGFYNGGGRVLDVSGELRGDLYRQGREIAHLWTGSPEGYRPNSPFAWGAQPHNGLV